MEHKPVESVGHDADFGWFADIINVPEATQPNSLHSSFHSTTVTSLSSQTIPPANTSISDKDFNKPKRNTTKQVDKEAEELLLQKFRFVKKKKNAKIKDLAEVLNVSKHTLSKWISGKNGTWSNRTLVAKWLTQPEQAQILAEFPGLDQLPKKALKTKPQPIEQIFHGPVEAPEAKLDSEGNPNSFSHDSYHNSHGSRVDSLLDLFEQALLHSATCVSDYSTGHRVRQELYTFRLNVSSLDSAVNLSNSHLSKQEYAMRKNHAFQTLCARLGQFLGRFQVEEAYRVAYAENIRLVTLQYAKLTRIWNHCCGCKLDDCGYAACSDVKPAVLHQRWVKQNSLMAKPINNETTATFSCGKANCAHCALYHRLRSFSQHHYNQSFQSSHELDNQHGLDKSSRNQDPSGNRNGDQGSQHLNINVNVSINNSINTGQNLTKALPSGNTLRQNLKHKAPEDSYEKRAKRKTGTGATKKKVLEWNEEEQDELSSLFDVQGQSHHHPRLTGNSSHMVFKCFMCHRTEASLLCLPCKHFCVCTNCASNNNISPCPRCTC